jgi:hypothetical protein
MLLICKRLPNFLSLYYINLLFFVNSLKIFGEDYSKGLQIKTSDWWLLINCKYEF